MLPSAVLFGVLLLVAIKRRRPTGPALISPSQTRVSDAAAGRSMWTLGGAGSSSSSPASLRTGCDSAA